MTNKESGSGEIRVDDAPGGPIIMKDQIIRIKVDQKSEYTLDNARAVVSIVDRLREGLRLPLLVDFSDVHFLSRPVRKYYSSEEVSQKVSSLAIISSSTIGKVIGNFFVGINRPLVPTRFMTNEEEAIAWLKEYL